MATKGWFRPLNPQKYRGNPSQIMYRSSYELKFMMRLDSDDNVIQWSSEEIIIPYRSPKTGRVHRYFPDFWVKVRDRTGKENVMIVEVKPAKDTVAPVPMSKGKKPTKRFLNEVVTWGVNNAKWDAAKEYCDDRKWTFAIFTERELGIPTHNG